MDMEKGERRGTKPVIVRLSEEQINILGAITLLDGGTVADQIRRAIDERAATRLADPELAEQIEAARNRKNPNT